MTETEKLLSYVKTRANLKYEGCYVIVCTDGFWRGGFGQPTLNKLLRNTAFYSLEELLNDMLQNENKE